MNQALRRLACDAAAQGKGRDFRRLHPLGRLGVRDAACDAACVAACAPAGRCRHCADACPHASLSLRADDGRLVLDPAACSGCGLCAAACPAGALAVDGMTLPEEVPAQGLVLSCERSRATPAAPMRRVPCLGALTLDDWLRLALAAGEAPLRLLDDGGCAACGNAPSGKAPWRAALETARHALSGTGMAADRLPAAVKPGALPNGNGAEARSDRQPLASRRHFFAGLSRSVASALAQAATGDALCDAAPARAPRRSPVPAARGDETRLLLLRLAQRHGRTRPQHALLPALAVSDTCRAHGACSRVCPTGALQLDSDSGDAQARLHFDAWQCIDCGACARICPSRSLTHAPRAWRPFAEGRAVLAVIEQDECERCGALFDAREGEAMCDRCRKAENLARAGFALFGPPRGETPTAPEGHRAPGSRT